jgi:hypothetical protein
VIDAAVATPSGQQAHDRGGNRPAIAAAALMASAGVLLMLALSSLGWPVRAVVWGGLAMAAYGYVIICLVAVVRGPGQGLASWRLGPWMMLWCGTFFGLATVTWSQPQTGPATEIALSSVLRALWLVAVGATMWALGYVTGPGHQVRAAAARVTGTLQRKFAAEVRSGATPWILYGAGSAARLAAAVTTGRIGYVGNAATAVSTASSYGQIIGILTLCAPLALAAAALQVFRERRDGARITLIVLFVGELAFAAVSGDKQNFVVAVLAIAVPFSAGRSRLPKSALAFAALVFLVVIIPFNQAYRATARSGATSLTPGQALSAAPRILRDTVTGSSNLAGALHGSVSYLLERGRDIDSPAIILQRTPQQLGFTSPAELVEAPLVALVPRALWPGKPILATGYLFGQQYFDAPATVYSSTTITPVGDLYRHGGWIPVIAGMFLLGALIRLLDDTLDARANPHALFLILLLFPSLVTAEQDWITLLAGIPATLALWLFAVSVTFHRHNGAATASA